MDWRVYVIIFALICLDVVTGVVGAIVNQELSSSKIREGIAHKFTYVVLIVLAEALSMVTNYVNIGFDCTAIVVGVCVLIILSEVTSILENCCKINPQLVGSKLSKLFPSDKEEV